MVSVIIFLHGGGVSWWSWKPQIEALQKKYCSLFIKLNPSIWASWYSFKGWYGRLYVFNWSIKKPDL